MKHVIGTLAVLATVAAYPAFAQDFPSNPPGTVGRASRPATQNLDPTDNSSPTNAPIVGREAHPATSGNQIPSGANASDLGVVGRTGHPATAGNGTASPSPSYITNSLAKPPPAGTMPPVATQAVPPPPMAAAAPAPMLSAQDRRFARMAAQGDASEIMEAKLALGRTANPDLKAFAQKMIDDHSASTAKLKSIAGMEKITLPTGTSAMLRAQYSRLARLHGAAFDRTYIADQKADHMKMMDVMNTEISTGQDPQLKQFATEVKPVVQSHIDMLQSMPAAAKQS